MRNSIDYTNQIIRFVILLLCLTFATSAAPAYAELQYIPTQYPVQIHMIERTAMRLLVADGWTPYKDNGETVSFYKEFASGEEAAMVLTTYQKEGARIVIGVRLMIDHKTKQHNDGFIDAIGTYYEKECPDNMRVEDGLLVGVAEENVMMLGSWTKVEWGHVMEFRSTRFDY